MNIPQRGAKIGLSGIAFGKEIIKGRDCLNSENRERDRMAVTLFYFCVILAGLGVTLLLFAFSSLSEYISGRIGSYSCESYGLEGFLRVYSSEFKYFAILAVGGFTVFAPVCCLALCFFRGAVTAYSALYLFLLLRSGLIELPVYITLLLSHVLTVVLTLMLSSAANSFSLSMTRANPTLKSVLREPDTARFIRLSVILSGGLVLAVALRCYSHTIYSFLLNLF